MACRWGNICMPHLITLLWCTDVHKWVPNLRMVHLDSSALSGIMCDIPLESSLALYENAMQTRCLGTLSNQSRKLGTHVTHFPYRMTIEGRKSSNESLPCKNISLSLHKANCAYCATPLQACDLTWICLLEPYPTTLFSNQCCPFSNSATSVE